MAKARKKNLSEKAQQSRTERTKKSLNPFEVHINKDKQNVLGRKNKTDKGLPGVSRAKAIKKRQTTLLQEYKLKNKDNLFLDKRIGEKNKFMTPEEKSMARFAAERLKAHKKKNIFNLNDEEVLTHRGQTLEEIEKFEDPKSDDEFSDDGNRTGKLDSDFVSEAHFGGGILSKSDSSMSRKDLIEQLIAESKKRKAEKQKIREQTLDLTEKLDTEWQDLLPLMTASKKSNKEDNVVENTKADDYDKAVRELKFEARGHPSDKLKSEEDIVKEEKEKLEALEADRLARMKGFVSNSCGEIKHKSADDLDDGFVIEKVNDEPVDDNEEHEIINTDQKSDDQHEDTDEKIHKMNSEKEEENQEEEEEEEVEEEEDDSNSESSEDNLSDLKESESSSEDEKKMIKKSVSFSKNVIQPIKESNNSEEKSIKSILKSSNNCENETNDELLDENKEIGIEEDLLERKAIMEKAKRELPYTYKAPETYEEFQNFLKGYNSEYRSVIIDRIIKCNHWSLDKDNKNKLSNLFKYMLQFICDFTLEDEEEKVIECFKTFDRFCPYFYDLAHMSPENIKLYIQEVLKTKHEEFENKKKIYPSVNLLLIFKLVSLLFPTSDYRHPVVTPCLVFMSQILLRSRVRDRVDVSKGLFICTLVLEYTVLSKRFAPSVMNFLRGILYTATPKHLVQGIKVIPPFKTLGETSNILVIQKKQTKLSIDTSGPMMRASDMIEKEIDDEFRIRAVSTALRLIYEFSNQLAELEAASSIFEPIDKLLKFNIFKRYPPNVKELVDQLCVQLENLKNKKLEYIVMQKKRPKPLKLYEPRIEPVYDGKKHRNVSKEKAEQDKLLHKYKKEMKGAIREIRRDRAFLAKVQIKQQIKSDEERKRKVKEIFGDAATQQSELKKFKRKK